MRAKPDTAKRGKEALFRRRETRSVWSCFNQRLISDFEVETQDFAFLCLIASANGLTQWPEGIEARDREGRFLTFH